MPVERGYERQVAPGGPVDLPQAGAAAFGAGVGTAVAALGETVERGRLTEARIARDQRRGDEWADFQARFAQVRLDADVAETDARATMAPGGAGYAQARADWLAARTAALTEGLSDHEVRRQAETHLAEFTARQAAQAHAVETGARIAKRTTDVQALIDTSANRVDRDPATFAEESGALLPGIERLDDVPAEVRDKLHRLAGEKLAIAVLTGTTRTNPRAAEAMIATGGFDATLSPEQLDRLRAGAEARVRMVQAQDKARAAVALTAQREALATRRAELDTGAGTPQDWAALAAEYEAIGDTSSAVTARAAGTTRQAALEHRGDTLFEVDRRIAGLNAEEADAGLSPAKAALRSGLLSLRSEKAHRLGMQGGALLEMEFATGEAIAPIDPADPASLARRAVQARRAAQWAGRQTVEPFTEADVSPLKDLMAQGAGGRARLLQVLAGLGDARAIDGAARQLAGSGDGAFRIAARMLTYPAGQAVAQAIVRGDEVRHAQAWPEAVQRQARADFQKYYGGAMRGGDLPADYINDLFEGASAYFASRTNGGAYDAGWFAEAIEAVLGRNGGRGGVARTAQGIVIAPPMMTPEAMMTRFAGATEPEYRAAAGGRAPVWADGHALTRGQLRTLLPTLLADGRYGFRGRNGALVHDDRGSLYAVDIDRLPAR